MTTVLVCKGASFPSYVVDCVDQFFLFNPGARLVLITDDCFPEIGGIAARYPSFENVLASDLPVSGNHEFFSRWNRMRRSTFRGGFWRFAIERFFVLEDYMEYAGSGEILHFEFDNMIYAEVGDLEPKFSRTTRGMSLPIDSPNRCIPSVVFIQSKEDIGRFCKAYNLYYLIQGLNDMKALSRYMRSRRGRCSSLPVLPAEYRNGRTELRSAAGARTGRFELFDNDFEVFGGIFDAAAIGQYLGGVDPRNDPPHGPGFINETAMYSPVDLDICWRRDGEGRLVPRGSCDGRDFPVFNLHIHSKNLAAFRSDRMEA